MYQFSDKTDNFDFFGRNFPKNRILRSKFQKSMSGFRISILEIQRAPFFRQNFEFLGPNLHKNGFWGRNFKILSLDLESTPPIYHVCQFSVKIEIFQFFGLNLGKLPNYV